MNYRTLTDNSQLSELISAIKPPEKPVELRLDSAMLRVAADNASRAKLIEQHGMGAQPPETIKYQLSAQDIGIMIVCIFALIFAFERLTRRF